MTAPGDLLRERYRVREVLEGGMGQILICDWEGDGADEQVQTASGAPVQFALKSFQRRFFFDSAARQSFVREASTWLRLSDLPHVMPVIAIEHIGDQPFIVMPAVARGPGGERSIADLLEHGPIDARSALAFAFQIAMALAGAGNRIAGLVHGDLKPANALLWNGDAFLSDFGLVSAVSLGRPDSRLQGTWGYRAPELWSEEAALPTVAGDVYAFGSMLFEMLTGRLPFALGGAGRGEWSAAHRDRAPELPHGYPDAGLAAAVMALALSCLAKDPAQRSANFGAVILQILEIGVEFKAADVAEVMSRAACMHGAMLEHQPFMRHQRVNSLLALDEPQQALEELDAIEPGEYDARLWVARGTALSLVNRADQALDALERGLAGELSPRERTRALSEYALALKRLGRFEEAQRIYRQLMGTVSDEELPIVVINLATVHLEQRHSEEAVRLLEPFVRKTPQVAEAWGNLGQGYAQLGRYEDAVAAYRQALALAPQNGQCRVWLAAVLMDHLGELDEAWAMLDAAFDSGYSSREWFVRMFASSLLLNRRATAAGLLSGLENSASPELGESIVDEAIAMARQLADRFGAEAPADVTIPDEPAGGESAATDESRVEDATVTADVPPGPGDAPAEFTMPFLNIRYYDFVDFTVDYYQWPEAEEFVPDFLERLRQTMRDPNFAHGATLRGSPFYFTTCAGCEITVLTNRDIGKRIVCRRCGTAWDTARETPRGAHPVVAALSAALGIAEAVGPAASNVHVLFVQSSEAELSGAVADVCRQAGMAEVGTDRLLSVYLRREAMSRGIGRPDGPWSVWSIGAAGPTAWRSDATPPELSSVIRALQGRGVASLSMTLSPEDMASMSKTLQEVEESADRAIREAIRSGDARAGEVRQLASILISRGQYAEAVSKARAAIAADESSAKGWEILGTALLRQDDIEGARAALEQSLARDPTSASVLILLARCHDRRGDPQRAAELVARARSVGGGPLA